MLTALAVTLGPAAMTAEEAAAAPASGRGHRPGKTSAVTPQTRRHVHENRLNRAEQNRLLGRKLVTRRWAGPREYDCLDRLWTRESSWDHLAQNPHSGAYGIPQALPGDKMASSGEDWRTNPRTQVKWGLRYIAERYGTPCRAWAHFQDTGWY